jgi:predicted RNA methylase
MERKPSRLSLRHLSDRLQGRGVLQFEGRRDRRDLGCGPVGQFAIRSAFLLGAGRVLAIDTVPERLALAREADDRFHGGG